MIIFSTLVKITNLQHQNFVIVDTNLQALRIEERECITDFQRFRQKIFSQLHLSIFYKK